MGMSLRWSVMDSLWPQRPSATFLSEWGWSSNEFDLVVFTVDFPGLVVLVIPLLYYLRHGDVRAAWEALSTVSLWFSNSWSLSALTLYRGLTLPARASQTLCGEEPVIWTNTPKPSWTNMFIKYNTDELLEKETFLKTKCKPKFYYKIPQP